MADITFNASKAKAQSLVEANPSSLQIILLKANEAEGALVDHTSVSSLLGATGNTEADFTNYSRQTGLVETVTVDDTNDRVDIDTTDVTWAAAGGTTNNTTTKALFCVQTGADDTTLIPLTAQDFAVTTDGSDLTLQVAADGFYRSA